jgi:hypothetical protein
MIDENKFWDLVHKWEFETRFQSSTTSILTHPLLNEVIQMGPEAIPLILKGLKDNWFLAFALNKLTGEWPVNEEYAGDGEKITECWFKWAKRHGYQV